jgi:hypothetical protein
MDDIKPVLDELNKIDPKVLKRDGRDFSFADVHDHILEIFSNLQELQSYPEFWQYLPEDRRRNLKRYIERFRDLVNRIINFNPSVGNPQADRDAIANEIKGVYSDFFEHLFPRLKLFTLEKEVASKKVQDLIRKAQVDLQELENQRKQGEDILKAMREASAVTGVSNFAGIFGEQASIHDKSAAKWLGATIISALGIGGFLYWIFNQLVDAIKDGVGFQVSLQVFLAKILLLSFFSVVFYQIVKNYNANMHLHTLNKHRENSLKSFQSFVEATDDPKIKDMVLIQATKAIFEAGDTGYISSKTEGITNMETIKIVDQLDKK